MKRYTLAFVLLLCIAFQASAVESIRKAKREINVYHYTSAITILKEIIAENDPKTVNEATFLLAECYRKKNDFIRAADWYGKVIQQETPDPLSYLYYGMMLRSTGEYQHAKDIFMKYNHEVPADPRGKKYAAYCDTVMVWQKRENKFEAKNAAALNTSTAEFGPVFVGNRICFTSDRFLTQGKQEVYGWTGNNYLKIFYADIKNSGDLLSDFSAPVPESAEINSAYHNGPATFDGSASVIYFNRTFKGKGKLDANNIREDLLQIFYSVKANNQWSKPKPFPYNSPDYSVGHPALTADGNTLYFVSNMPGGIGGTDIYMCHKENDKWSKPVNLGPKINTEGNEMFPEITDDGILYFASDGLPGYGGLDVYISKKVKGEWSSPENIGAAINSSFDDFALAPYKSGKSGLFCSNRPGGAGDDDIFIYREVPPAPVIPPQYFVSGCVKDKVSNQPVPGATVFLLNEKEGKVLVVKAGANGCFKTPVILGISYKAKAMQPGYIADCESFQFDAKEVKTDLSLPRDLMLDKLAVNRKFVLENIYYDFDKWNIRPDAEPSLNSLVKIMTENNITVELGSHTDCRGTAVYNQKLSQRRAESAVQYIITHGINPSRITAKGYGESEPVNKCVDGVKCTEEQHQANRRTEFKVVSFDLKPQEVFNADSYKEGEMLEVKALPTDFFKENK
jgi:outer membrane protein OmpA-like peptidoglycan-associated protein/tetratricopeptide (TPR) repeat protein